MQQIAWTLAPRHEMGIEPASRALNAASSSPEGMLSTDGGGRATSSSLPPSCLSFFCLPLFVWSHFPASFHTRRLGHRVPAAREKVNALDDCELFGFFKGGL